MKATQPRSDGRHASQDAPCRRIGWQVGMFCAATGVTELVAWDVVVVRIADTGLGITEVMAPEFFVPFATTRREGMGIGLSIARAIVEEHGGQLSWSAKPGEGSMYWFTLATHQTKFFEAGEALHAA